MQYSETVMEHFRNPHNVGRIENPDGVGEVGNPVCGDMMTITIKVKDNRIDDVKFETFGCGAAIAVSSMVTDMAKGKTLEEAMNITNKSVAEHLGGLPQNKLHCSNLGADALHKAIQDYLDRKEGRVRRREDESVEHVTAHEGQCYCPYCDMDLPEEAPYCIRCGKPTLIHYHD
ncbi:Fe-S cluster assembly scaffold protein NifU [Syntrophorhabdus aromaticivorans]|jgi:nitrogen fixation NifU-like protein|uniref:Fe-S cluster assembly scaffold protein NifU n=1 Tax=Syntrophorhabdus aromaticivorans TaxID=328301 RepID=A0A351U398_9BACT|nr:Fe-S cluster assembly scaffold protein NifU [Syntrophorhabdus aromaticivorans]HBA54429.1 Fe-S cluster assembly scaffold protein NifU [Syntrophorhabdus aromaticivorans]